MSKTEYILSVNGKSKNIFSSEDKPLLYILREEFNLIGTKLGCGLEQCGSCAVLVDGNKVLSCNRPAIEFVDKEITTIEGISKNDVLNEIQQSFKQFNAAQCGYCTSGIIVSLTELFNKKDIPDRNEIVESLSGQLCRCGSHVSVLKAVNNVIKNRKNND
jgi:aerobic-type carbon monoxide dehydrogenase small subunit (CoxS/CutS family)|tara:strand:+ start:17 stop:496 length:480 start_codon:yes stop_codon:yes gene_type:complete